MKLKDLLHHLKGLTKLEHIEDDCEIVFEIVVGNELIDLPIREVAIRQGSSLKNRHDGGRRAVLMPITFG